MAENDKVRERPALESEALEAACVAFWGVRWGVVHAANRWALMVGADPEYTEQTRRAVSAAILAYLRSVAIRVSRPANCEADDRPSWFSSMPEAFDFCREADRPVVVEVEGIVWELSPSGKAIERGPIDGPK